ncbi:hypothetical protein MMC11_004995 [Xylographa trunciseda]|nr:hypothetical protein [Xylographa trunciseda]
MSETDASEASQSTAEGVLFSESLQSLEPSRFQYPLRPAEHPEPKKDCKPEESLSSRTEPATPVLRSDQRVNLQVGERRFTTTKGALMNGSHFFARMLSGRWPHAAQEDGSYFIDADGAVFEHILRYIRHSVFPVHYDSSKGHDFGLYALLLEQARFFQVDALEKWLENKKYLGVVKTEHRPWMIDDVDTFCDSFASDVEVQYHPFWATKRVYVCPRGITVHRGNPDSCGRACKSAQGDADDVYVKQLELKIVATQKKTVFVQEACFEGSMSS